MTLSKTKQNFTPLMQSVKDRLKKTIIKRLTFSVNEQYILKDN